DVQENIRSSKAIKIEDASKKAMCAIDGAGFATAIDLNYGK
ncbi:hypothetical protein Tco_1436680, partial [Tanacetum coccineum]